MQGSVHYQAHRPQGHRPLDIRELPPGSGQALCDPVGATDYAYAAKPCANTRASSQHCANSGLVTTRTPAATAAVPAAVGARAHFLDPDHPGPDIRALCGTQLLGVKAAAWAPRCLTCEAISRHEEDPYG
ncbi:MAG: hypothetical protein ACTHQQ_23955 [Solirubrobacteraceae bacterium]